MSDYMVKIDKQKMKEWVASTGMKATHISKIIKRSDSYISLVICNGQMSAASYQLLKKEFGISDDSVLLPTIQDDAPVGYHLDLMVKPDRVKVTIMHGENEVYSAFSRVKDNTELSLMQAISYAAHMCYKLAEQKDLSGEKA